MLKSENYYKERIAYLEGELKDCTERVKSQVEEIKKLRRVVLSETTSNPKGSSHASQD